MSKSTGYVLLTSNGKYLSQYLSYDHATTRPKLKTTNKLNDATVFQGTIEQLGKRITHSDGYNKVIDCIEIPATLETKRIVTLRGGPMADPPK